MPEIRLQVYFKRKGLYSDSLGLFIEDNDELMCNLRNKLSWF